MGQTRKCFLAAALMTLLAGPTLGDEDRHAKQAQLDAACEAARQAALAPLKAQYVEECVVKKQRPDRESCERFYADYGNRSGDRAPLFYDLPACVSAYEYRKSYR